MAKKTRGMSDKTKKILSVASFILFIAFSVVMMIAVGGPIVRFVSEPEQFRAWVDSHGIWGRLGFIGMVVIQIIIAIIPGEPFEIVAGYAFGVLEGTLLSMTGIVIGSVLIFLFVRYFGVKAVEVFFSREKINSLKFLRNTKRLNLLVFIVFFIPGTPKDLLSYFVGLTDMKFWTWFLISATARIPSVITSAAGGDALGLQNYQFAVAVFAVTAVISGIGILIYRRVGRERRPEGELKSDETAEEIRSRNGGE